jgi:hypothetical protein
VDFADLRDSEDFVDSVDLRGCIVGIVGIVFVVCVVIQVVEIGGQKRFREGKVGESDTIMITPRSHNTIMYRKGKLWGNWLVYQGIGHPCKPQMDKHR